MLRFIDDETYRRRILVQLNRGESRHQLARTVFHGKRGELLQRYRKGQEDQLGALGFVLNLVVLWNTMYIEAPPNQHPPHSSGNPRAHLASTIPLAPPHPHKPGCTPSPPP